MRSIKKNRKQRFTYLPVGIRLLVILGFIWAGLTLWDGDFVWVVSGFYIVRSIIRMAFSFLLFLFTLVALFLLFIAIS